MKASLRVAKSLLAAAVVGTLALAAIASSSDCELILDRVVYEPGDIATLSIVGDPGLVPILFFSPKSNAIDTSPFAPRVFPPIGPEGRSILIMQTVGCDDPEKFMQAKLVDPRTRQLVCITNDVFLAIDKAKCDPQLPDGRRMTGGGSIFQGGTGIRFTHGFELHCNAADEPNNLEINWEGNQFHLTELLTASCSDDPSISEGQPAAGFDTYEGTGIGRLNGVDGASISFKLTDAGEPGKFVDLFEFTISDGVNPPIFASGYLRKGNQQAHK